MEIPESPGEDIIRILGIDPGTDTLGVAILDVSMVTYEAIVVYAETFKASKEIKNLSWMETMRGGRDARLKRHSETLYALLNNTTPTLVAAESPFLQRMRVNAFEALVECYAMLRNTIWMYSPGLYLRRIDPISAKNYCGVSHIKTDKTHMYAAITSIYKGKHLPSVDLLSLDEHSIDAIAICHCLLRKYILGDVLVSTKAKKKSSPRGTKKRRSRRKRKKK